MRRPFLGGTVALFAIPAASDPASEPVPRAEARNVLVEVAESHGARVVPGDGPVLAVFAGNDRVLAALRAAGEMLRRVDRPMASGLHVGICAGGPAAPRSDGIAERAAGLCDLAPPGSVYVDREVRRVARRAFAFREVRAQRAVFADQPVLAHELVEAKEGTAALRVIARPA